MCISLYNIPPVLCGIGYKIQIPYNMSSNDPYLGRYMEVMEV